MSRLCGGALRKPDFLIRFGLDNGKPVCFFLLIGRVKRMRFQPERAVFSLSQGVVRLQFDVSDRLKTVRNRCDSPEMFLPIVAPG